jgi:small basic protein
MLPPDISELIDNHLEIATVAADSLVASLALMLPEEYAEVFVAGFARLARSSV